MRELIDSARDIYVGLLGNRLTVLGELSAIAGINLIVNPITEVSDALVQGQFFTEAALVIGGLGLAGTTMFGTTTKENYQSIRNKIRRTGRLDRETIESVLDLDKDHPVLGYCQLQGAYFAAKGENRLEDFYRIRGEVSKNIIPNF